jgi:TATA-box binding protein (TBP) (component of TFIID and TFIIIB)
MEHIDNQCNLLKNIGIKNFNFSVICKIEKLKFDLIKNKVGTNSFDNCIVFNGNKINYKTLKIFKTSDIQITRCKQANDILFAINDVITQLIKLNIHDEVYANIDDIVILRNIVIMASFKIMKTFDEIINIVNKNGGSYKAHIDKTNIYDPKILRLDCKLNNTSFYVHPAKILFVIGKNVGDIVTIHKLFDEIFEP